MDKVIVVVVVVVVVVCVIPWLGFYEARLLGVAGFGACLGVGR